LALNVILLVLLGTAGRLMCRRRLARCGPLSLFGRQVVAVRPMKMISPGNNSAIPNKTPGRGKRQVKSFALHPE
jgi:hypothetical protein